MKNYPDEQWLEYITWFIFENTYSAFREFIAF